MMGNPIVPMLAKLSGVTVAAIQMGGCGFCTGLGTSSTSANCQNCPLWVTSCSVQTRRITSRLSVKRPRLSAMGMPRPSYSILKNPRPTPRSTRPWLRLSRHAVSSATSSGFRYGSSVTAVPSRSLFVRAAIAARATIGLAWAPPNQWKWCSVIQKLS